MLSVTISLAVFRITNTPYSRLRKHLVRTIKKQVRIDEKVGEGRLRNTILWRPPHGCSLSCCVSCTRSKDLKMPAPTGEVTAEAAAPAGDDWLLARILWVFWMGVATRLPIPQGMSHNRVCIENKLVQRVNNIFFKSWRWKAHVWGQFWGDLDGGVGSKYIVCLHEIFKKIYRFKKLLTAKLLNNHKL